MMLISMKLSSGARFNFHLFGSRAESNPVQAWRSLKVESLRLQGVGDVRVSNRLVAEYI
jgi:hypothetical protein